MTILDRYFAKTILLHTLMVMAVLLALMTLVTFIGQQDDIGQGSYNVSGAFLVTLLQLPQQTYELLPIGALIGAITGLGGLARDSELTVVRAAGVSVSRIALSAGLAGLVVAALLWVIGEYFAPPADQYARQYKIFSRYSQLEITGSRSAWIREGPWFINVRRQAAENLFGGVYVYELDEERRLKLVGRAETATQDPTGRWVLSNYAETRLGEERVDARTVARLVTGFAAAHGSLRIQGAPQGKRPRFFRLGDRVLVANLQARRGCRRLRLRSPIRLRALALGGCRRTHGARHLGGGIVRADHPDTGEQRAGLRSQSAVGRLGADAPPVGGFRSRHLADPLAADDARTAGEVQEAATRRIEGNPRETGGQGQEHRGSAGNGEQAIGLRQVPHADRSHPEHGGAQRKPDERIGPVEWPVFRGLEPDSPGLHAERLSAAGPAPSEVSEERENDHGVIEVSDQSLGRGQDCLATRERKPREGRDECEGDDEEQVV